MLNTGSVGQKLAMNSYQGITPIFALELDNRELAQKPREPYAAFGHCAKPRAEMKFDVTEKPSQWKGSWVQGQVLVGEELSFVPQLQAQDAKSVGSLSGSGVIAGKTAPPGCASTRSPFG
jgi:hypothetical protein